ncbi:MAG: DUF4249 family protein [Paludibacteraceae bacterium]|nr:DUF4249 family protein [Paludibacteraceae bacterium]
MKHYLSYILFVLTLLTACEHKIPYNGEYQDPQMVVQAIACAGEDTLTCFVGRSYFFLDSKPAKPEVLDNLTISLMGTSGEYTIVRDSTVERLHHLKLSRKIQAGDTLHLSVSHPTYGTAEAEEILMPDFEPQVLSYTVEPSTVHGGISNHTITMQLPDYPFRETVVGIAGRLYLTETRIQPVYDYTTTPYTVVGWDTVVSKMERFPICSFDPVFAYPGNRYSKENGYYYGGQSKGLLFMPTDYPSGKQLQIYMMGFTDRNYDNGSSIHYHTDSLVLTFEMKSDAYYLYQSSMEAYLGLNNSYDDADLGAVLSDMIGTEEEAPIYNNMTNGFGAFISKTRSKLIIKE